MFKETGDTKYIYKNELDKTCFKHCMAYGDFKDLAKRTASDKVLIDKAFKITSNPKYDEYERGLDSMVHRDFGKTAADDAIKNEITQNQQLVEELHKPIIRKLKKNFCFKKSLFII